ncbi:MAG TPA: thioredoxin domain-containing protein [Kineosporiaceae bacterium]
MGNARQAKNTREKAAQLRQEAERQQARRRNVTVAVSVLALLALIIGMTVLVRTLNAQQKRREAAAAAPPANLYTATDGLSGVLYGKPAATVTVTTYEDFQCPACQRFEETDSAMLRSYADQGKIKIVYRPVAILDRASTTNYSTRAGSAAAAVLNVAPDKYMAFHDALFKAQPEEGSAGLADAQLLDIAAQAGVPKAAVEQAITSQKFKGWLAKVTDDFTKKYNSTPTILVNGTQITDYAPDKLKAAIDKAIG